MCNRYLLTSNAADIARAFDCDVRPRLEPRYNIAPTQPVPVIRAREDTHARRLDLLRWGLVPSWAKNIAIGDRLINARSESAAEKPAFRAAMRYRRCLLPADGFYAWAKPAAGPRQPHVLTRADGEPLAIAGLWEHWQDEHGNELDTCVILTTAANELIARLHDRMPVILDENDHAAWLDPDQQNASRASALLRPYPADRMTHRPISLHVNNPHHEDERGPDPPAA
ncbi:MAG: SOS response-associated peptidase [Phycisphaeraceae bacterium]